mmetsp:Transcript_39338/g.100869  ORF Transcript_39338/g.100869 Transcript_39338/m.100869 type:complete len:111 (-) Transcript_39338:427-759(-)
MKRLKMAIKYPAIIPDRWPTKLALGSNIWVVIRAANGERVAGSVTNPSKDVFEPAGALNEENAISANNTALKPTADSFSAWLFCTKRTRQAFIIKNTPIEDSIATHIRRK